MNRAILLTVVMAALVSGCRGQVSTEVPFHLWDDMVWQPKYHPQGKSGFFSDHRQMRFPVADTVATEGFEPVKMPAVIDEAFARRGQERLNIYCAPCHDRSGHGNGLVVAHGYPLPIDYSSERALGLTDQYIFDTITNGVRNMPGYGTQIPPLDRWAIVVWLRVLQRSQHATIDDVPPELRAQILPPTENKK